VPADLITAFAHYLELEARLSPRTVREYSADVRQFRRWLEAAHPQTPWAEVAPAHLRGFLASRRFGPHRQARVLSALHKFFWYLLNVERLQGLAGNPVAALTRPRLPERLPKYREVHEVQAFLEAALRNRSPSLGLRDYCLARFLVSSGLRLSACLGLTLEDVRYRDGFPHAVRYVGKGNKEREKLLTEGAAQALAQWLKHRKGYPAKSRHLWIHLQGRAAGRVLTPRAVQLMFKRVARRAGLDPKGFSPHTLRHSFATWLRRRGVALDVVREALDHASIQTTQIYARVANAELEAALREFPNVM
jgi:integrase/recombinase XerD